MNEIALGLSIVSSLLLIVYLAGLIFGKRENDQSLTVRISGRIITTTVTRTECFGSGAESAIFQENRVVGGGVAVNNPAHSKPLRKFLELEQKRDVLK